jgi:hypothetical protein
MLTFFRKIRKSLLGSGQVRKYLLYAISEILLVMVGILLALQVNNWNQEYQRKDQLKTFLESMKSELKSDLDELTRLKGINVFRYYSLQHILVLSGDSPLILRADEDMLPYSQNTIWEGPLPTNMDEHFIEQTFLWASRSQVSLPSTNTIDELKNTGLYSYLDIRIKKAIDLYYNEYKWRAGLRQINNADREIERWANSLAKSGVIPHDISGVNTPLNLITEYPERIAFTKKLIRFARWFAISQDSLSNQANETIQLIEEELKRL